MSAKRCSEVSARKFRCELPEGHEAEHVARGNGKVYKFVVLRKRVAAEYPSLVETPRTK